MGKLKERITENGVDLYLIKTWKDQPGERLVFLILFTFQYCLNHGGSDFLLAG